MQVTPVEGIQRVREEGARAGGARSTSEGASDASVRRLARMAGGLWLMVVATGLIGLVIVTGLIVRGDAAATAEAIRAGETLYRLGYAVNLTAGIFYMAVAVLFYGLLKPVSPSVSLLAASFGVTGVVTGAAATALGLAPVVLLGPAADPAAFAPGQLEALAYAFRRLERVGGNVAWVFFGLHVGLMGSLIARSTFIPRMFGMLLIIGGSAYVINAFALLVVPTVGARLAPFIPPIALLAEGALAVWLVMKGVDAAKWHEQSRAAADHAG